MGDFAHDTDMAEPSGTEALAATEPGNERGGDLSVTALYTSQAWSWGGLPCAHLFATKEGRGVFRVVNAALLLARLFMWRLRSLRHALVHRHTLIDALLRRSGTDQTLELAAGLSRRGATFSADDVMTYTEVDLPHVVRRKRELLARTAEGQRVASRPNLRLVEGDVTNLALDELRDPGRPLFVIAEGLLMYLKPEEQRALWARIGALLQPAGGTFVFDLVPTVEQPRPGPIGRALDWLMKRFTGGRSFERDERTRDDIAAELRAAGFAEVAALEPCEVAAEYELPFPERRTQQLVFVCRGGPLHTGG